MFAQEKLSTQTVGMPLLDACKLIGFAGITDAAQAKAFYGEKLGLRLVSEDPFAIVFNANGNMLRLAFVGPFVPAKYTVLGWEVPDIAAAASSLQSKGIVFERFPGMPQDELGVWATPGGDKVAWFKDPDGNLLSLSQHVTPANN